MPPDVGHTAGIIREQPKDVASAATFRADRATHNPGLKPWAVLYSRFAAESAVPEGAIKMSRSSSLSPYPKEQLIRHGMC